MGAQRGVQTLSIIVLARLLVPEDFGLVAVAVVFLSVANRVKSLGLHTALIQHRGSVEPAADTCLVLNAGLTVAAVGAILAFTPLAGAWFGDPRAGLVVGIMSLRLIPQAIAAIPMTLAVRALNFRKQMLIQLVDSVLNAVVAVVLALRGWGVWALVAGALAGPAVAAVLWWLPPPWRVRLRLDREAARLLLGTGIRIWSSGNLSFIIDSANRLFIGGFLGISRLGFYEVTSRLVHIPLQSVQGAHDRVAVPAFCREQDDRSTLARWFLKLTMFMLILTSAGGGVLLLYADLLVPLLLGETWRRIVVYLQVLVPFAVLMPLLFTAPIYIAVNRVDLLLRLTAARAVVTIAALAAAAQYSLVAVCAVESAMTVLFVPINVAFVMRLVRIRPRQLAAALAPAVVGLGVFCASAILFRGAATLALPSQPWLEMLTVLPAFLVFVVGVFAARPGVLSEAWQLVVVALGVTFGEPNGSKRPDRLDPKRTAR